ncbi:MAG: DNA cytosine methyltransferase [Bacteroidia bacterium]|nr:DNA cytosine methyltransferase [Bacteroidia bacterium]
MKMARAEITPTLEKPAVISLFCGAGGLDLGFKQEGYAIPLAIDSDRSAIETHCFNFQDTSAVIADLTAIGPTGVQNYALASIPIGSRIGIIGGPPCQGFSRGNISSDPDDPRNLLPALYIEIISKLQETYTVEFVVFENVMGMKDKKHEEKYSQLISGLSSLSFDVTEKELCAADFGVPQNRYRVIVTAVRSGQRYSSVTPIKNNARVTVRDAIGHLSEPAFYRRKISPSDIPLHPNHWTMQPKSPKFLEKNFNNSMSRSFRKLSWEKPSPTIAFGNREIHVHPNGHRRLSIFEAMLLQGFPIDFELKGNLSQQVQQVSNAVPPPLARSLAKAITISMNLI